jgi:opacity protein-like surface antigen
MILMKKKVLAGLVGAMLVSSVGLAAPVVDLNRGETSIGYNYSSLDIEINGTPFDTSDSDGFYVEHALNDKVSVGVDHTKTPIEFSGINLGDMKVTDVYAKYKLNKNIYATLGNRNYNSDGEKTDEITIGLDGIKQLTEKVNGYAGLKSNDYETELQIGATYALTDVLNLDVNYKHHDYDDGESKGFGLGVNYKF